MIDLLNAVQYIDKLKLKEGTPQRSQISPNTTRSPKSMDSKITSKNPNCFTMASIFQDSKKEIQEN